MEFLMDELKNFIILHHQLYIYIILLLVYTVLLYVKRRKKYLSVIQRFRKPLICVKKFADSDFVYNTDCPICFSAFTLPIKSDCGHGYCLDCLYSYWKKSSWNNLCPLCRKPISNLKPAKSNGSYYVEKNDDVLKKLRRISSRRNIYHFTVIGDMTLSTSTYYSCFFCAIFLFLWTYAVSNFNKMIYFIFEMYNTLYDTNTEINVQSM